MKLLRKFHPDKYNIDMVLTEKSVLHYSKISIMHTELYAKNNTP